MTGAWIAAALIATIAAAALTVPIWIANVMSTAAGGTFWPGWILLVNVWCTPVGLWIAAWRSRKK